MSRASRYRIVGLALASLLSAIVALTACSDYAEGDRCETLNGSGDCQSGLVCTAKSQINAPYNNSDRCCPSNPAAATHPACTVLQSPVGDATAPFDTGPTPDAAIVTPAEAAAPEASTDASDDGG
jgi:hypothetical protein